MSRALVLGGGGSAAVGWELGVLQGLAEAGFAAQQADTLIGTSAGAIVAARLASSVSIALLYKEICTAVAAEALAIDYDAVAQAWMEAVVGAESAVVARRRIGAFAQAAETMPEAQRRGEIRAMLPAAEWPQRPVTLCAVSAESGEFATLTASSGVDFVDAVAASCAVPGVWPPVTIGGELFMDGAVRSPTNTSVAQGHEHVLVLAPMVPPGRGGIDAELSRLHPAATAAIVADAESVASFGNNPLDPGVAPAAAEQGYRQGLAEADRLRVALPSWTAQTE
ncbi:NTE family protein [Frankineae bacterium MT45]|nr:NTE family protein [Frankineae bacterium MT45]